MKYLAVLSDGRERAFAKRDDAVLWIRLELTRAEAGTGELRGGKVTRYYEVGEDGIAHRVGWTAPKRPSRSAT